MSDRLHQLASLVQSYALAAEPSDTRPRWKAMEADTAVSANALRMQWKRNDNRPDSINTGRWTREENDNLDHFMHENKDRVDKMGDLFWLEASKFVQTRTFEACRDRWRIKGKEPVTRNIKPWSEEEDARLLQQHATHQNRWRSYRMEHRTVPAIKKRMRKLLEQHKVIEWTAAEDEALIATYRAGERRWAKYPNPAKHPASAIQKRVRELLPISAKRMKMTERPWSTEDDVQLRYLYDTYHQAWHHYQLVPERSTAAIIKRVGELKFEEADEQHVCTPMIL